jgi:hypothetical protein
LAAIFISAAVGCQYLPVKMAANTKPPPPRASFWNQNARPHVSVPRWQCVSLLLFIGALKRIQISQFLTYSVAMGYKVITLFVLASLQKYDIIFIAACPP